MAGSATDYLQTRVLSHTLAFGAFAAPSSAYVALTTSPPSSATPGTEVGAGGSAYARQRASFALSAGHTDLAINTTAIEFPTAARDWGAIGYFELWDAPVGGNRLYWGALVDPTDAVTPLLLTVAAGDIVRFSVGTLGVQTTSTPSGSGPYLPLEGGQLSGPVFLSRDPVGVTEAATKAYVDSHSGSGGGPGFLPLSGGTMLGDLTLARAPTATLHAASKAYVDAHSGAIIGDAPTATTVAPLWWDSVSGQLFVSYNDGTSTQWVSANSTTAETLGMVPEAPVNGSTYARQNAGWVAFTIPAAGAYLPLSGGTVTGRLTLSGGTGNVTQVISATTAVGLDCSPGTYSQSAIRLNPLQPVNFAGASSRVLYYDTATPAGLRYATGLPGSFAPLISFSDVGDVAARNLTLTGTATVGFGPTNALDVATKGYVDTAVAGGVGSGYLPTAGGTVTGLLTLSGGTNNITQQITATTAVGLDCGPGTYSQSAIRLNPRQPINFAGSTSRVLYYDSTAPAGLRYGTGLASALTPLISFSDLGDIVARNLTATGKATVGVGPTDPLDLATKGYVDTAVAAGGGGGGGIADAPSDGTAYGRLNAAWTNVLPLTGGTVSGATTFSGAGTALIVTNTASVGGLTASGAVSGAGFTALLAPYATTATPTLTGTVTIDTIRGSAATLSLGTATNGEVLRLNDAGSAVVNRLDATYSVVPNAWVFGVGGAGGNLYLTSNGAASIVALRANSSIQFSIGTTASAVNNVQASGSTGTNPVILAATGTGANLDISLTPKGTGVTRSSAGLGVGGASGPTWTSGAGVPAATQPIGSLYSNTSGAAGARLYVSAGGGTWTAIAGV